MRTVITTSRPGWSPCGGFATSSRSCTLPATEPEFVSSGLAVDCPPEKNLCLRAYRALHERFPIGGVRIHLHKIVPMGAGLGGGSADAAFVVKGLSELFGLNLSRKCMEELCAGIGSDTAFFVANRPALATGRGEILEPVDFSLRGKRLLIVKPAESVSNGRGLCRYRAAPYGPSVARVSERSCWPVAGDGAQRFRACRVPRSSAAGAAPQRDVSPGAVYASMTGSGAAVYGIFDGGAPIDSDFGDVFVYQEDMV